MRDRFGLHVLGSMLHVQECKLLSGGGHRFQPIRRSTTAILRLAAGRRASIVQRLRWWISFSPILSACIRCMGMFGSGAGIAGTKAMGGAPDDGSAWIAGDSSYRIVRGGCWSNYPWFLRAAVRFGRTADYRDSDIGFRLGRTLNL